MQFTRFSWMVELRRKVLNQPATSIWVCKDLQGGKLVFSTLEGQKGWAETETAGHVSGPSCSVLLNCPWPFPWLWSDSCEDSLDNRHLEWQRKLSEMQARFCHCGGFAIEHPSRRLFHRKEAEWRKGVDRIYIFIAAERVLLVLGVAVKDTFL